MANKIKLTSLFNKEIEVSDLTYAQASRFYHQCHKILERGEGRTNTYRKAKSYQYSLIGRMKELAELQP